MVKYSSKFVKKNCKKSSSGKFVKKFAKKKHTYKKKEPQEHRSDTKKHKSQQKKHQYGFLEAPLVCKPTVSLILAFGLKIVVKTEKP